MLKCTTNMNSAYSKAELSANADVLGLEVAKLTRVRYCATYDFADEAGVAVGRLLEHDHIALYNTNNMR